MYRCTLYSTPDHLTSNGVFLYQTVPNIKAGRDMMNIDIELDEYDENYKLIVIILNSEFSPSTKAVLLGSLVFMSWT